MDGPHVIDKGLICSGKGFKEGCGGDPRGHLGGTREDLLEGWNGLEFVKQEQAPGLEKKQDKEKETEG